MNLLENMIVGSYLEKGFLVNKEYINKSEEEREKMDKESKRPYYKQSSIVFLILGVTLLFLGVCILSKVNWIIYLIGFCIFILVLYIIISSINIKKNIKDSSTDIVK